MRDSAEPICWRILLTSSRDKVFRLLSTDDGRASFWAESAKAVGGCIEFRFKGGSSWTSRILTVCHPEIFELEYIAPAITRFELKETQDGGTELTLTESGGTPEDISLNLPGWVSVLLNLKSVADHGIDLRNASPHHNWDDGYVDS